MRADNHGEGGILALTALVMPGATARRSVGTGRRRRRVVVTLGVFGTALLYGDGLITPAISVLVGGRGLRGRHDGVRGLGDPDRRRRSSSRCSPSSERGTAGIAKVFGPVMVVWFAVLGVLGLRQIVEHPEVLKRRQARSTPSTSSSHAAAARRSWRSARSSSSSRAARRSTPTWATSAAARSSSRGTRWCCPALVLNYFGQAALLVDEPEAIESTRSTSWRPSGRSRRWRSSPRWRRSSRRRR